MSLHALVIKCLIICQRHYLLNISGKRIQCLQACILRPTHQLDVPVSNDGAELTQVPHQGVENLSDAFPLVAAHFLDTGQLRL